MYLIAGSIAKIIMGKHTNSQLIGKILHQAGLVSKFQLQVAAADRQFNPDLLFGEVLSLRGWIEQQTADFFADEWQDLLIVQVKQPLGYYLQKSGLLTPEQITAILEEQQEIWLKFGSIAILKGFLAQQTIDFFLENLFPSRSLEKTMYTTQHPLSEEESNSQAVGGQQNSDGEIDYDDIPWIH